MVSQSDLRACMGHYLKELRLTRIGQTYEAYATRAVKESLSYERYLYELVEEEYEVRRRSRIERLLKESRLPLEKSFETFDKKRLPWKVIQMVNTLSEGSFLDRKENVLAFGNPGSGKTHLLCAIGQELIRQKVRKISFTPCSLLVQELLRAKKDLRLAQCLKRLSRYDAIIIDDIGYVQQDRQEMEVLFTLLADRYERGSIMLTSNLPFSKWERIFKDPMVTVAAIDRLVHHSVILELNIPSYRIEKAKNSNNLKEKEGLKKKIDE